MNGELTVPISELKRIIKSWLCLEDDRVIDVLLAAFLANQFQTDPLWLIVIGPPSSAKTELLRAFDGQKKAYFLSNMTPSTLVSGLEPREGQGDPSLLLKLDEKILILKDFTTILSMRSENRQEILAQLREIYDGKYAKAFGTGKEVPWEGHMGLIAACTPVYDRHYGVIGALGDRFLLYRITILDQIKMGQQAQRIVGKEDQMRKEIRESFHKFLNQFSGLREKKIEVYPPIRDNFLVNLASFCAAARCSVERSYKDGRVLYDPASEGSPRLVKQLKQLGMGLALVHGKDEIDLEIYSILCKVGRDLISSQRLRVIKYLVERRAFGKGAQWVRSQEIADGVSTPKRTIDLILEDLMIVGLLNRKKGGQSKTSAYLWQLTRNAIVMMATSLIFNYD